MTEFNDILTNNAEAKAAFKVSEGYFDSLPDRIMANIPEEVTPAKEKLTTRIIPMHRRNRVWQWAAACACIIIVGVTAFLYSTGNGNQETTIGQQQTATLQQEDAVNQAADYMMIDNQDMYQMLADENE